MLCSSHFDGLFSSADKKMRCTMLCKKCERWSTCSRLILADTSKDFCVLISQNFDRLACSSDAISFLWSALLGLSIFESLRRHLEIAAGTKSNTYCHCKKCFPMLLFLYVIFFLFTCLSTRRAVKKEKDIFSCFSSRHLVCVLKKLISTVYIIPAYCFWQIVTLFDSSYRRNYWHSQPFSTFSSLLFGALFSLKRII